MQTVPTLVGTSTAIAAAASGFVFAQSTDHSSLSPRTGLLDHRPSTEQASVDSPLHTPSDSRPGASLPPSAPLDASTRSPTTPRYPYVSRPPLSTWGRPQSAQIAVSRNTVRRHSIVRHNDPPASPIPEASRDSLSSSGSWIRRLSIRPVSQHGSLRSSNGPDSPSIFSQGSAAPILPSKDHVTPSLPPNKLVKRTPLSPAANIDLIPRRRSRSHLPTLRRPATSHQRSATLQSLNPELEYRSPVTPTYRPRRRLPAEDTGNPAPGDLVLARTGLKWTSFFHAKAGSFADRTPSRIIDRSPDSRQITIRRINPGHSGYRRVHLVKPTMVLPSRPHPDPSTSSRADEDKEVEDAQDASAQESLARETPRRVKRSISMSFSSAGGWVSRTSGSIRRSKRGAESRSGGRRYASEPLYDPEQTPSAARVERTRAYTSSPSPAQTNNVADHQSGQDRKFSSPIPPISRLSTFQVDLFQTAPPPALSMTRQNQPSGSSTSSTAMSNMRTGHERSSSMMDSSDAETRDFCSGDDDTDFRSDGMFDSIRTFASARVRALDTPVESMYDESPPSTAGNGRTKRHSIQEVLARTWDGESKITEEEETTSTPVRAKSHLDLNIPSTFQLQPAPNLVSKQDEGRFSLDDDFDDDDWARSDDDETPGNPLSPPSQGGSLNSGLISPNIRLALADISGNGNTETTTRPIGESSNERPLSSIFDWSEPSAQDRQDVEGHSPRPKTAYAKQELDTRSGRSALRKGPTPTHVRSQSVPVVHETSEDAKPSGAKYGTWGLGTKTVSEDWDEDFEFGGTGVDLEDKSDERLFAVPEAIRATQPSVKAHSGQIRELSLLVNDLKRLCRHARDFDMLEGAQRGLWKEAEGIIALASPDEDEDDALADHLSSSSIDLDAFEVDDRFVDAGFGTDALDGRRLADEVPISTPSKNAVPTQRAVFSPEDDIFGGAGSPSSAELAPPVDGPSRPRTPHNRSPKTYTHDVNGVVQSMVVAMQHRSEPDAWRETGHRSNRMHFDTNSLKVLVKRAGDLRDLLSDMIRQADQITQSPVRTPRPERHLESSPAFTRVFDDPGSSPPRRMVASRGRPSMMESTTPENSPSSAINRSMQAMTVG